LEALYQYCKSLYHLYQYCKSYVEIVKAEKGKKRRRDVAFKVSFVPMLRTTSQTL
jgi:hypothetical protein